MLHRVSYVSIREKIDKDADGLLKPRTLYDMIEGISKAIRIKLKNVKNESNGSFIEESLLPCELLILLNLLMNGSNHEEAGFSLPVKPSHKLFCTITESKEGEESHLENRINGTTQIKNPYFFFTLV